jgi:hypothetical protein
VKLGYIGMDVNELFQPRHIDHLDVDGIPSGSWIVYGTEIVHRDSHRYTRLPGNYRQRKKNKVK